MPQPKKLAKTDVKKITRAVTAAVVITCMAGLAATAWFITATLNGVAAAQTGGVGDNVRIEGIDNPLLDEIEAALSAKTSTDARLTSDLPNPFRKVPPPPVEPAPEPEEPAPAPEPPVQPEPQPNT